MLTADLDEFLFELDGGTLKHVGASNSSATVTLYDVVTAEARAFGTDRVKLACEDESGNEVTVALDPDQARSVIEQIETSLAE